MRMNLEQTYKTVVIKEMLEEELRDLENIQEKLNRDKTVSKAAIRKLVKRAFIWMPIFMIFVNYIRNGIDPFILIYTPVFLFYTAIYMAVIVSFIWMYNTVVKFYRKSRKDIPKETAFYEQNKVALHENIETVDCALKNNSTLIPMYRSKEVLEQLIAYKKEGRARNDEDAIDILERERPVSIQPAFVCTKNRFATLKTSRAKLSRLGQLHRYGLCLHPWLPKVLLDLFIVRMVTGVLREGVKDMFKLVIGTILMVFLIVVIGSLLLEQFPTLIPLWEELKMHVVNLYESSLVKYGTITTLVLIVAIFIMVGSSKKF